MALAAATSSALAGRISLLPSLPALSERSSIRCDFQQQQQQRRRRRSPEMLVLRATGGGGESVEVEQKETILPSGEWPENFSMLNFEDLTVHLEPSLFKAEAQPSTFLADVMSRELITASPDALLEEVDHHFSHISGLPVVDKDFHCVGVLSKKDRTKGSKGLKTPIREVMSSPAITLSADKTVSDAAVFMLKNKFHRIPVVNNSGQVIGIVTRTDIFTAMEGGS
ncbi:uncharacterized protein LOC9651040 [Selaginella moellendorffii]|uniref:uncharacterized protein LOC9651040 n=1 Tax=Selaginella moellendorffii TaxID=88036 RepID=UPI000D1C9B44|nr:uncharacterized protein LOC9651040 [Selaginella moellendorffii]|eukprot:XP_024533061.1 uncharacterized protein LOC9651040 [Selaginella moellendorffii]